MTVFSVAMVRQAEALPKDRPAALTFVKVCGPDEAQCHGIGPETAMHMGRRRSVRQFARRPVVV